MFDRSCVRCGLLTIDMCEYHSTAKGSVAKMSITADQETKEDSKMLWSFPVSDCYKRFKFSAK